jgi:hypothetical protein
MACSSSQYNASTTSDSECSRNEKYPETKQDRKYCKLTKIRKGRNITGTDQPIADFSTAFLRRISKISNSNRVTETGYPA